MNDMQLLHADRDVNHMQERGAALTVVCYPCN